MRSHLGSAGIFVFGVGLIACRSPGDAARATVSSAILIHTGPVRPNDGSTQVIALLRAPDATSATGDTLADIQASGAIADAIGGRYLFAAPSPDPTAPDDLIGKTTLVADPLLDRIGRYVVLNYPDGDTAAAAVDALLGNPAVETAVLDPVGAFSVQPNDPAYLGNPPFQFGNPVSYQWALQPQPQFWPTLNLPQAWDKTTGHAYLADLDNGIMPGHPELDDPLHPGTTPFRAQLSRGFVPGAGSVNPDPSVDETADLHDASHGTHTAGILVAPGNNGVGVAGMCWGCSLIEARIETTATSLSAAIQWSVNNGAQVLNMSFAQGDVRDCDAIESDPGQSDPVCDMLVYAARRDVVIVAAVGNEAAAQINFPSSDRRVIAVGGIQSTGARWCETANCAPGPEQGSNIGLGLSLVAPARDVLSTTYAGHDWSAPSRCGDTREGSTLGALPQGYGTCTGTSMATPHVTGIAGLVRSANPLLSADAVRTLLQTTASSASAYNTTHGYGVPNASLAVQGALRSQPNLRTPLFAYANAQAQDHLYTTIPQQAEAAVAGTLQPLPRLRLPQTVWSARCAPNDDPCGTPDNLVPVTLTPAPVLLNPDGTRARSKGVVVMVDLGLHYDLFSEFQMLYAVTDDTGTVQLGLVWPTRARGVDVTFTMTVVGEAPSPYSPDTTAAVVPNYRLPDPMLRTTVTRADVALFTANPAGTTLVPLYRLSFRCGDDSLPCANPYHLSHVYTTEQAGLVNLTGRGYKLDGIEGYLFPNSVGQPAGTVPLCRLTSNVDDWILFPGIVVGGAVQCARQGYFADPEALAFIGWVPTAFDTTAPTSAPDAPPSAQFTTTILDRSCYADAETSSDDLGIAQYAWSWGDGTTTVGGSGAEAPTHTYAAAGNYTITLAVTDSTGHTASVSHPITAVNGPNATFAAQCTAARVCTFNSVGSTGGVNYRWDFDDESAILQTSSQFVTHTYAYGATFQVHLTVSDAQNYETGITEPVIVPD